MVSLRKEPRTNASNNRTTSGEEGTQSLPTIEESQLSGDYRLFSSVSPSLHLRELIIADEMIRFSTSRRQKLQLKHI